MTAPDIRRNLIEMELAALAMSVTALIARSFIDAAGDDAGKGAWMGAKRLYTTVRDHFAGDDRAEGALLAVQNDPVDGPGIDALAAAVEARAAQDEAFRTVLENLVSEARSDEAGAAVVNQFFGDTRINKQVNIGTVEGSVHV